MYIVSFSLFFKLLLILHSRELHESEEASKTEDTPNNPEGTALNELPGELIRIIIEELHNKTKNIFLRCV